MKKIYFFLLSVILIAALAVTAFAAGKVTFTMTASEEELSAGDSFTLTVSCASDTEATSYGLMLKFDEAVFEVVGGEVMVDDALVKSFGAGTAHGFAFMFEEATAYSGQVGTAVLKVKASAPAGSYTITGAASVKNGSQIVEAEDCAVTVTVSENLVTQESTATSEPLDVGEILESVPALSVDKAVVEDVLEGTVPVIEETPNPGADSTLTIGAMPEEKNEEDEGFPAWIFLVAAGVIAVAGIIGFVIVKKKK